MEVISLAAATTLTGWSERTFWRRFADGSIQRKIDNGANGKTMIDFDAVRPHICMPFDDEDFFLVKAADSGDADARNDLALVFLSNDKPKGAIFWLDLAARQDHADAMHWLGRCYTDGIGIPKDENLGIMWLSKAAASGHVISQAQMQAMRERFTGNS